MRPERIADYIRREVSQLIITDVADSRLKGININHVDVSADLSIANVFFNILGENSDKEIEAHVLKKFSGMLRSKISKTMKIKRVPKLIFIFDDSSRNVDNINSLLDSLKHQ